MRPSFKLPPVRVVSTARVVMAAGFFANDLVTSRFESFGDFSETAVLAAYAAIAAAYLAASYRRVAFEARWLRPMMAVDWVAFAFVLATSGGFQSAYFAMFGLLILGAVRTVGMGRLLWIALGIFVVFAAAGIAAHLLDRQDRGEQEFALGRIIALVTYGYMAVALAAWQPKDASGPPAGEGAFPGEAALPDQVLAEAARLLHADRGLVRWSRGDADGYRTLRNGNCTDTDILGSDQPWFDGIYLYDCRARLTMRYAPDGALIVAPPNAGGEAVARLLDAAQIVFIRLPGVAFDSALAIAIDTPLDENFAIRALDVRDRLQARILATLAEESQRADAKAAERAALARNLHDSAIQSLASIRLQLASLKEMTRGTDGESACLGRIVAIDATANAEMKSLRQLVGDLDAQPVGAADFLASLRRLAAILSGQWQIACTLDPKSRIGADGISGHRAADTYLVIREAVSNAVRHGAADRVSVRVRSNGTSLAIEVTNNGRALPKGAPAVPRTLQGRVSDSGGHIELGNTPGGVRLSITMPAS